MEARSGVSVIIGAYNAAATLAETLDSVCSQSVSDWEIIVVDDGSSDDTAAIARRYASRDARIRVVQQVHAGVSVARNAGVGLARFDWIAFLDADDWLRPLFVEQLTAALQDDRSLDAAHCGWAARTFDGAMVEERYCEDRGDLFAAFARRCAFPINACVVRRSLVEAVGGFDSAFPPVEDWVLWQRIARMGARFGKVRQVLCAYRMGPQSQSADGVRMLTRGLPVIQLGHGVDPRVPHTPAANSQGRPPHELSSALFGYLCWCAGLVIAQGQDARPLLGALESTRCPTLAPDVGMTLFEAVPRALGRGYEVWSTLGPRLEPAIAAFLDELERRAAAPGLARGARIVLERRILGRAPVPLPCTVGLHHAVRVDVAQPFGDFVMASDVERLLIVVELKGETLGRVELPVCDSVVPATVVADAIAAQFAWPILGRFFGDTIYPQLNLTYKAGRVSAWRGRVCVAAELPADETERRAVFHDRVGWTIFLQELWNRPNWDGRRFYARALYAALDQLLSYTKWFKAQPPQHAGPARHATPPAWTTVEVSEPLPTLSTVDGRLDVEVTAGGVGIAMVPVRTRSRRVSANTLLSTLTIEIGYELCRVAVREALIGRTWDDGTSLRTRLATAQPKPLIAVRAEVDTPGVDLTPRMQRVIAREIGGEQAAIVFGRYAGAAIGTSGCRRSILPAGAASDLELAAKTAGEPVVRVPALPGASGTSPRVVYAPDLLWRSRQDVVSDLTKATTSRGTRSLAVAAKSAATSPSQIHDRHYFEALYASRPDPWQYTTPYEQTKYQQTLSMLPPGTIGRALELACAEGHFTQQLAPRVESLVAADISDIALQRAAARCSASGNVQFVQLDLFRDPLPGRFDLIVCSEVLYYAQSIERLRLIGRRLANALEPRGHLVSAHANLLVDEPDQPGYDWNVPFGAKGIGGALAGGRGLRFVTEMRTPLYRIQLFRRATMFERAATVVFGPPRPAVMDTEEMAQPESSVAARVRWTGGRPVGDLPQSGRVTSRLPILMYHRIASSGNAERDRYRVTPAAFEEQLRYLRDAGFHSVRLSDWRAAVGTKRPLPGRAVLITFDDGFRDVLTDAQPLLRRYGFSATVFVVTDHIGGRNAWDDVDAQEEPLLDWESIRSLSAEGLEFGSHTATHRQLTRLPPVEIVREAARSRAALTECIGAPVNALSYPYGDQDAVVQHLIGACGYTFGLTSVSGRSGFDDSLLALPRIEVTGATTLDEFIGKLGDQ